MSIETNLMRGSLRSTWGGRRETARMEPTWDSGQLDEGAEGGNARDAVAPWTR